MSLTAHRIYQFGEFRLRVGARVLERNGKPIQLGSRSFEVLICLVTHAGETVTKDQLLKAAWPESFVEENNLSQHILALRRALGDQSTYIVTIPGRGYQFTETVRETLEPDASPDTPQAAETATFVLQRTTERTHITIQEMELTSAPQAAPSQAFEPQLALPPPRPSKRNTFLALALLALIVLAIGWFVRHRYARPVGTSQKIVLAELDNRTGDAGFDVVLRNALEIDLDQSPYLDVMGEAEALNTLQLMGRTPETALIPVVAREVCVRSNRQVLITGAVASLGSKYLLTLQASDCVSGKILAAAKAESPGKDQALDALDAASARLRHDLGESAESLEHFQVPIAQATTSSLEALKQYSIGEFLLGRMGKEENDVLPFFQRAFTLDPHFVMAAAAIATSYQRLGEYQLARPYYETAFTLSSHVSEKERLYIQAHYYADYKGDILQGIRAYRMWADVYPRDWGPWLDMAIEYTRLGQFPAAIAAGKQALALNPSRGIIYGVLARDYLRMDRYGESKATALHAISMGRHSSLLDATLFQTALLEHDSAAMAHVIAQGEGKPDQWNLFELQALAFAKEGKLKRARESFHAAYVAAARENLMEKADGILIDEANTELQCGLTADARATLHRIRPQTLSDPQGALLATQLGDSALAERVLAAHAASSGSDTLITYVYDPQIRAAIALNQHKPEQAATELEHATDYDFAVGFAVIAERAEAYRQAGQPAKSALEYTRILDHAGVDPVSPLFPLAWLGLARAEAQLGHANRSRADYEKLFALWSQADPDLPQLVAAHREYAGTNAVHPPTPAR